MGDPNTQNTNDENTNNKRPNPDRIGPQCVVPGFSECNIGTYKEFKALEDMYPSENQSTIGEPCTGDIQSRSLPPETEHPDITTYHALPESILRFLRILNKLDTYEDKKSLILEWQYKLLADTARERLMTPIGIDGIIKLAAKRDEDIAKWKESSLKGADLPELSAVVTVGEASEILDNEISADNDNTAAKHTCKLSPTLLRQLVTEDKWADISPIIKAYQDELEVITKELEAEGKKCTGCALNPYRSKAVSRLRSDFTDPAIISDEEIASIKEELGVKYIQVGSEKDKDNPYVR